MEYITVKELFKITKGKKVEEIDYKNENSIRYIQIDDLRNNNNIKHCENINKYVIAKKEDIIIAWDGANAGTIGFGIEGAIGSTLAILRKENKEMDTEFCGLFLRSKSAYLREKCTGATIPHIQRRALEDIKIPKISLNKQIEIKNIINKAQELIDKRKEQIQDLDELVKSQFIEMFGDPITNPKNIEQVYLKDLSKLITKGASPNWQGIDYVDDETQTLFVTSENVREGYIDLSKKKFLMDAFNEKQKRSVLQNGDFLINIVGASIGRAAQFNLDIKANINQAVALVRLKDGVINDKYLLTYLNSPKALKMYESMQVSVARANLSLQNINDLEILLPPIELQNKFADFVKQVDKLKFEMEKSLKELEDNFNALMQKAFNGELFN